MEFDRVSSWGCHLEEAKKLLRHELLCLHLDSTWGLKHGVPSLVQDSKDSIIESTVEDSLKRLSVSLLIFLMLPVKKRPFNIDADVKIRFPDLMHGWTPSFPPQKKDGPLVSTDG